METIEAIRSAVIEKLGSDVDVMNVETIDIESEEYASVVKVFNTFGVASLPIIILERKPVCIGTK